MCSSNHPRQIHGIDFSGAKDAGKKIWIASGIIYGDTLQIENCRPAAEALPGSRRNRDQCLPALRDFIASQGACAIGLDFPFGLPRDLAKEYGCWEDFVLSFPDRYPNLDAFRRVCREAAGGREPKRVTDQESQTPFSPCNLRLYRQTYFGIRDVLHPLVRDQLAYVLPMQSALAGKPWILEVCPASTLKQEALYQPYKGRREAHRQAREHILREIEEKGLSIPAELQAEIMADCEGDALDSVIAAFATFRALHNPAGLVPEDNDAYKLEGYVHV
jgi:hypothetical protein